MGLLVYCQAWSQESSLLRSSRSHIAHNSRKMVSGTARKKHICNWPNCGKSFNRSDHLQRHTLNHEQGNSTCPRCSAHFKRQDLLGGWLDQTTKLSP
jgi:uncharacterized Zn-finger protein